MVDKKPAKRGSQYLFGVIKENLSGWMKGNVSMTDIAREAGVSCERVRQVMKSDFGLTKKSQMSQVYKVVEAEKIVQRRKKEVELYGDTLPSLDRDFGSLVLHQSKKYLTAKRNVERTYGAVWRINFRDWLRSLMDSGIPYDSHRRVCLSRKDFNLPYQPGNLHFMLVTGTGDARKRRVASGR